MSLELVLSMLFNQWDHDESHGFGGMCFPQDPDNDPEIEEEYVPKIIAVLTALGCRNISNWCVDEPARNGEPARLRHYNSRGAWLGCGVSFDFPRRPQRGVPRL